MGISKSSLLKLGGWSRIDSTSWIRKDKGSLGGRKGGHVFEEGPHSQGTCPAGFPEDAAVALRCSAPAADPPTGATLPPLPAGGTAPLTGSRLGFEHRSESVRGGQHARLEENLP